MKDKYEKTVEVYKQLGKKYLQGIDKVAPPDLPDFAGALPKDSLVLDVGCAGGRDSKYLIEAGHRVVGIDIVEEFLEEARKKAPEAVFKKMDLRHLEFPANYFDAVWANAVLLHFKKNDVKRILSSFYNILKPDGLLYVAVRKGSGVRLVQEKLVENNERLFVYYEKGDVEDMVKEAGFGIIKSHIVDDPLGRRDLDWVNVWGKKK